MFVVDLAPTRWQGWGPLAKWVPIAAITVVMVTMNIVHQWRTPASTWLTPHEVPRWVPNRPEKGLQNTDDGISVLPTEPISEIFRNVYQIWYGTGSTGWSWRPLLSKPVLNNMFVQAVLCRSTMVCVGKHLSSPCWQLKINPESSILHWVGKLSISQHCTI